MEMTTFRVFVVLCRSAWCVQVSFRPLVLGSGRARPQEGLLLLQVGGYSRAGGKDREPLTLGSGFSWVPPPVREESSRGSATWLPGAASGLGRQGGRPAWALGRDPLSRRCLAPRGGGGSQAWLGRNTLLCRGLWVDEPRSVLWGSPLSSAQVRGELSCCCAGPGRQTHA